MFNLLQNEEVAEQARFVTLLRLYMHDGMLAISYTLTNRRKKNMHVHEHVRTIHETRPQSQRFVAN